MMKLRTHRLFAFIPAQSRDEGSLEKLRLPAMLCIVVLFCAAAVIAAPAQNSFFTTLANFNGTDGRALYSGLAQGTDGNFYGTTYFGGAYDWGTVFKMTPSGTLTTLYSFNGTDGSELTGGLVQGTDGNFYGTTDGGGAHLAGMVFRITPAGTLTTLYSFCSQQGCPDGEWPWDTLVEARDGNFYGTTYVGGLFNGNCMTSYGQTCGTVFKITPTGALTTLYRFCSRPNCTDGENPHAGLVQGRDGNFYGTTVSGGVQSENCPSGCGTVFKIAPGGVLITLHSFDSYDGESPSGTLVQASDGNFYGTTQSGTVFKMTPSGTLTTLQNLSGSATAGLVLASDGNFYGTTNLGGDDNCYFLGCGTVFKMTPSGTLTTLHTFEGSDGEWPYGGLVQAPDGFLYGTTNSGGTYGEGTIFRVAVVNTCITCRP
jgi:uncharacterized repeat protein (TIGR03803 family)